MREPGENDGELPYPAPYRMEEYIRLCFPRIDARLFGRVCTEKAFVMRAGLEERVTSFYGWFKTWNICEGDGIRLLRYMRCS